MPSSLDTFFWVLAIAGTTTFALKTLLLTFSGHADGDGADVGHGDAGHHDASAHHGSNWAFQFFTIQSLAVFAMGAGWMGLAAEEHFARSDAEALAAATLFGVALAALMIKVMSKLRRLESSGTLDAKNAVGGTGTVYLTVPQDGAGQIEIVLQGRLVTWDAVSPAGAVPTGARVRVEAVDEAGRLVVSPV
jgi:hypothetical protein